MAIGPDRVQVLKQESAGNGGDGADDVPYTTPIEPQEDAIESAGLYLQDAGARDETVGLDRDSGQIRLFDQVTPSPITLARTLAVSLAGGHGPWLAALSGAYRERIPPGPFPSQEIWWTDSGKTKKIAEALILAGGNVFPTQIRYSVYAADGTTVIAQVTDTITRSGAFETSRTRVIT